MDLTKAFSIVVSLACENVLEERDCDQEEVLLEARADQIEALNIAHEYLDSNVPGVGGCGCGRA